ncbi:MAG: alpha-glucuronidase [Firmicutes bacterium]|nr:alpha-glucuronidase [Bacillota bacterium]
MNKETRCSFTYKAWLGNIENKTQTFKVTGENSNADFAIAECKHGLGNLATDNGNIAVNLKISENLPTEGFSIVGKTDNVEITGGDKIGLLYGVYKFLTLLRQNIDVTNISLNDQPTVANRILNHWDNIDGSVERGYAGKSIFFRNNQLHYDADRLQDYARLLASVGINQICLNNVNVYFESAKLITEEKLPDLAKVADIFRPFGIRLIIAVHFESPVLLGGIQTADPLDEKVAEWWQNATKLVYKYIPDLVGFLMKADSEFRSGPAAMGRTQAEGARPIAKALQLFGGIIYWRCFIYNCMQDWRDTKTDRPKAAYDYFYPLDGKFEDNVILQIKHGPSDFQVREPNSPLLGAMQHTPQNMELQITQEYTGQQKDLYTLAVQWDEVLEHPINEKQTTRDIIGADNKIIALSAVANVGDDENWTGHLLAQANLYAFARLAWNPKQTPKQLTQEWIACTFGNNPKLLQPLTEMMLKSRAVYEQYNAPLGIGWMVNIHHHYGPSVDGYEYMKWGTYHRADTKEIGVNRTAAGTGYTTQYQPYVRDMYENLETCPQDMLLYFHRLPYNFMLKSGKTLIQHIYDTHFEGVEGVEEFIKTWDSLKEFMPQVAHESVKERFAMQLENAKEWRDVVNSYFYRKTGIDDAKGRKIYV